MDHQELNRRDFHRLTAAAFGGMVAGSLAGCSDDKKAAPAGGASQSARSEGTEVAAAKSEPHACRGLNACKNQGESGKNDCAGQGTCATKEWRHTCASANACKGQGGCGANPTENDCKGQGACNIPLMDDAWEKARKRFAEKMEKAGKKFGEAPPKSNS
ncbi:MAG TPA: hypothetical protein VKU82_06885 [Planctomycetaceae bacterium]|nr:hypothetical protein [Planctomycetaceae bacterium]